MKIGNTNSLGAVVVGIAGVAASVRSRPLPEPRRRVTLASETARESAKLTVRPRQWPYSSWPLRQVAAEFTGLHRATSGPGSETKKSLS